MKSLLTEVVDTGVGHLEIGSTDHFEGISASHSKGQTRAEMARTYIIAVTP